MIRCPTGVPELRRRSATMSAMRLKPGMTLEHADEVLRNAERAWTSARSGNLGFFRAYTDAIQSTYVQVEQVFATPDLAAGMRSSSFWNLLALGNPSQSTGSTTDPDLVRGGQDRLRAMNYTFSAEIENQVQALTQARAELVELKKLAARPGLPIVYDTNMLIHWRRPSEISWREVLKDRGEAGAAGRLVVPLRVVDELDRQKYGEGRLADRATNALRYLYEALKDTDPGQPTSIRNDATLEIWIDTDERGEDADLAILRCAADLTTLHPSVGARVLTGDLGMRLRAQHMDLKVLQLPDSYRKPTKSSAESTPVAGDTSSFPPAT
jgi:hypothetical protein